MIRLLEEGLPADSRARQQLNSSPISGDMLKLKLRSLVVMLDTESDRKLCRVYPSSGSAGSDWYFSDGAVMTRVHLPIDVPTSIALEGVMLRKLLPFVEESKDYNCFFDYSTLYFEEVDNPGRYFPVALSSYQGNFNKFDPILNMDCSDVCFVADKKDLGNFLAHAPGYAERRNGYPKAFVRVSEDGSEVSVGWTADGNPETCKKFKNLGSGSIGRGWVTAFNSDAFSRVLRKSEYPRLEISQYDKSLVFHRAGGFTPNDTASILMAMY